jgi:S-adenosylmethionine:tRNA ribosyltransferase-isomerase
LLPTAQLEYELPPELIAVRPAEPRDAARLLVVRREGDGAHDRIVRELPGVLKPGDLLVFNTTHVLPARFRGRRVGTGGKIEGLYLHEAMPAHIAHAEIQGSGGAAGGGGGGRDAGLFWIALIKGRHTRPGAVLELHDPAGQESGIRLAVLGRPADEPEAWIVRVEGAPGRGTREVLDRVGLTPLPPYILKARKDRGMGEQSDDPSRYQTVYARADPSDADGAVGGPGTAPGSVAAPTAGLHFTPELLEALGARGVARADVVLHVGAGTFRPVETEFVEEHPIHAEWCGMSPAAIRQVQETRSRGGRVIPVGTTAVRTLEAYAAVIESGEQPPEWLATRLLITPGYCFRWCDGMLTNFHLPRSSLMALVAAMLEREGTPGSGVERLKLLYAGAVARGYRFYSFGDAMLIE